MIIATVLSLTVLLVYLLTFCMKNGIPNTISETYYLLNWKPLFTLVIYTSSILILPVLMELTPETQIIPFLGISGMLLVGTAPRFKEYERSIHVLGATLAGTLSQLWIILYGCRYTLCIWIFLGMLGIRYKDNLDQVKFFFWIELVCFMLIYTNILLSI